MVDTIKKVMAREFKKFNSIKKCPFCNSSFTEKSKYKRSCAMCGKTIKYSPDFVGGYKIQAKFERLKK